MKLKQIIVSLVVPSLVLSAFAATLLPATPAAALTTQEKKACYEKWAGGYVGTAGDGKKLTTAQYNQYKASKCAESKKGSCKEEKFSDGAVLNCQRKDGQYDSGAGWTTTDGGDNGEGGDDGTDTGTPAGTTNVDGNDCGGVETAIIKCDADNSGDLEKNGVWGLLIMVLNVMTAGIGILAVGGIVYGAVLYTTAEDKADQVKKATDIITNVVIGLIAYALMWAGLNFIVPGGVFS